MASNGMTVRASMKPRQPGTGDPVETGNTPFALADGQPVPAVTAAQMREVDRAMTEDFGIELVQMMENAGRNLADLAWTRYAPGTVVVLAGPGGNGGGGLAAARHLLNRGADVTVVLAAGELAPVPAHQLSIARRMGIPVLPAPPSGADLVIDALLGYSLHGDPAGRAGEIITWANGQPAPLLALDTPSGLDVTTGHRGDPCVRADATLTLALPKTGLAGSDVTGRLFLGDISVPALLYQRMGIGVPLMFRDGPVTELADSTTRPAEAQT
jgi:NAD(P)H-hydrate epimerase